jgi:hypothetical protein
MTWDLPGKVIPQLRDFIRIEATTSTSRGLGWSGYIMVVRDTRTMMITPRSFYVLLVQVGARLLVVAVEY